MASGPFLGSVKSFNPAKGWGFVDCEQTMQMFGQDVFLLKSDLQGMEVSKGDQVSFNIKQSPKGVQATNVQIIGREPEQAQPFIGELKSFNPEKGFGFITCLATQQLFGKDVFVSKRALGSVPPTSGTQVQFKAVIGEKGPVASEVQVLGAGAYAPPWALQMPPLPGWPGGCLGGPPLPPWNPWDLTGLGMSPDDAAAAAALAAAAFVQPGVAAAAAAAATAASAPPAQGKAPGDKEVFFGELKAINKEKGWGHIYSLAWQKKTGKDVFVMRSNLQAAGVRIGEMVSFNVTQGPKGPHAVNLRPFVAPGPEEVFTGHLKSFNDDKGWGFIKLNDEQRGESMDVFLHKKELTCPVPKVGARIQFALDFSTGRPAAKTIAVLSKGRGGGSKQAAGQGPAFLGEPMSVMQHQ